MTSVETKHPTAKSSFIKETSIFSLTVATLQLRNSWTKKTQQEENIFEEKIITLEEVSYHDSADDCWIVIYDRVYDVTKFLNQHPGGADVLLENAGRDATVSFRGTGHSSAAIDALRPFYIGRLPRLECIYRKTGGIITRDLPE